MLDEDALRGCPLCLHAEVNVKKWKIGSGDKPPIDILYSHFKNKVLSLETFSNRGEVHSDTPLLVKRVEIPKLNGIKNRGIPCVADGLIQ